MEDNERARAVRALLRERGVQTSETAAPIPRRTGGEMIPASSAQARIWFHTQLAPASIYYNVTSRVALRGTLDLEILERTVSALADRQAVLRTTFEERDGHPVEIVRPSWGGTVTFEDVSAIAPELRAAAVEQRAALRAALPFDLVNGPVMRVHVIRRGSDDHVVFLNFHHIAVDGWAEPVVLAELAELYSACAGRRASALPLLAAEYADFAIWHHRWLATDAAKRQLAYWRSKLAGAPEALRLPFDQPHTGSAAGRAREHAWVFAPATTRALEQLSTAEAISAFAVLFTAWAVLLSQYSGQRDLVIATLIANRTRPETESLVGFFVNTLPIRVNIAAGVTFRTLLGQVKQVVLEAFANQDAPFDAIVKQLKVERSASDTPLSNVLFADQRVGRRELRFGDVAGRVERFHSALADAHFPITFNLEDFTAGIGEGMGASVLFRSDLFEVATIEQMCRQFDRLLGRLVADPDRNIDEFAILEPETARALLDTCRGTPADRSDPVLLHEMFDRQVARSPDAIAVAFHGQEWSYRELDRRASQLAERLARYGGGEEPAFGIYLPRGLDVAVAVLGILKAGGAYVALDPSYPAERLRQMISASGVRYLITRRGFGDATIAATAELVELDGSAGDTPAHPYRRELTGDRRAIDPVRQQRLGVIYFTSGSTGRPKAVAIPHLALVNFIEWQIAHLALTTPATTMQVAPLGFDTSFEEMFTAWSTGSRLEIVNEETRQDPAALAHALDRVGAQRWLTSYIMLQQVAEVFYRQGRRPAKLELVICSGEALHLTPAIRHLCSGGVRLINQYGPTETLVTTAFEVDTQAGAHSPPIGRPIIGCEAYVLDDELGVVPVGFEGELYLGGLQVARGYLGQPGLTAERFVPDPFGAGGRLYRTGDRARYRFDGELQFLGRNDDQVKIRGNRVELAEIEAALLGAPGVAAACAAVEKLADGDRLVAAAVPIGSEVIDAATLKDRLAATLPGYAVPARIAILSVLPKTPNGKVDRRAVIALVGQLADERPDMIVAPRNDAEARVLAAFVEVSGVDPVSVTDDFFAIGGDSIRAVRLVSLLGDIYGRQIPLRSLFIHPTVEALAANLGAPGATTAERGTRQTVPRRRDPASYLPMLWGEQRAHMAIRDPSRVDTLPLSMWIDGPLDVNAMTRAVALVVARHPLLRATFELRGDSFVHRLAQPEPLPIVELDEAGALELDEAELVRGVDLTREAPFRMTLIRVDPRRHLLAGSVHHAVFDAGSEGVFDRELWQTYNAIAHGGNDLPRLAIDPFDLAAWERDLLDGPAGKRQWEFWRARMRDAQPVELPLDFPRTQPPYVPDDDVAVKFEIAGDVVRKHASGGSLYPILLTALGWLLHEDSKQDRLTVQSSYSRRDRPGADQVIGMLNNPLLMPIDVRGCPTPRSLLPRARELFTSAIDHPDVPLYRPFGPWLGPSELESKSQPDMFRASLNYVVEASSPSPSSPGIAVQRVASRHASGLRRELQLACDNDGRVLDFSMIGKRSLFRRATLERLATRFREILLGLI